MKEENRKLKKENGVQLTGAAVTSFRPNYFLIPIFCALLAIAGCKPDPDIIYQVDDVEVTRPTGQKGSQKSLTEFISIAYADVIEQSITQDILIALSQPYSGFGDLKYIEDLIIRNLLNAPNAQLPTEAQMRADVNAFVIATYQRFFNRNPNEFEQWYLKNLIDDNPDITPELVYYSIMTSDEYRYY
jgi:hypothetical protein